MRKGFLEASKKSYSITVDSDRESSSLSFWTSKRKIVFPGAPGIHFPSVKEIRLMLNLTANHKGGNGKCPFFQWHPWAMHCPPWSYHINLERLLAITCQDCISSSCFYIHEGDWSACFPPGISAWWMLPVKLYSWGIFRVKSSTCFIQIRGYWSNPVYSFCCQINLTNCLENYLFSNLFAHASE